MSTLLMIFSVEMCYCQISDSIQFKFEFKQTVSLEIDSLNEHTKNELIEIAKVYADSVENWNRKNMLPDFFETDLDVKYLDSFYGTHQFISFRHLILSQIENTSMLKYLSTNDTLTSLDIRFDKGSSYQSIPYRNRTFRELIVMRLNEY